MLDIKQHIKNILTTGTYQCLIFDSGLFCETLDDKEKLRCQFSI